KNFCASGLVVLMGWCTSPRPASSSEPPGAALAGAAGFDAGAAVAEGFAGSVPNPHPMPTDPAPHATVNRTHAATPKCRLILMRGSLNHEVHEGRRRTRTKSRLSSTLRRYVTLSNSTSKTIVAFDGMSGGLPAAP